MGTLADLNRTFGAEMLGDQDLARKLSPLLSYLQINFSTIRDALSNGLTFTDNLDCEIVSAKFSHNVPQNVRLKRMKQATAAVILGCDGAISLGAPMLVNAGAQQVRVTVWFNDPLAASKTVNLLILNVGPGLQTQPTSVPVGGGGVYISGEFGGSPSASKVIFRFVFAVASALPVNLAGSVGKAGTAATGSTTFNIQKNGVTVGTMIFAAAGTVATFAMASATSFAAGDVLTIVAPGTQDATLADLTYTLGAS